MQEGRQEFGDVHAVTGTGSEKTGRPVDGDGVAVVGVALDNAHETKQLEVAKQQLVLAGVVAVGGDDQLERAVEHALNLRQVVAVQQGFGCGRFKAH